MSGEFFPVVAALRDALATVPGVKTCRVGMESNMTPADYPMVRVVPGRVAPGPVMGERWVDVLVYFGEPIHEFTGGMEAQWQALSLMERTLLDKAEQLGGFVYTDTILDEDRIDAYKLLAIRGRVAG